MEHEGSLSSSQKPETGPFSEPHVTDPHPHILMQAIGIEYFEKFWLGFVTNGKCKNVLVNSLIT